MLITSYIHTELKIGLAYIPIIPGKLKNIKNANRNKL